MPESTASNFPGVYAEISDLLLELSFYVCHTEV